MLLNHLGADLSGYALDSPTDPSLYNLCNLNSFVKSTIADIRDLDRLLNKIEQEKPEIIIHMAGKKIVRKMETPGSLRLSSNATSNDAITTLGTYNRLNENVLTSDLNSFKSVKSAM